MFFCALRPRGVVKHVSCSWRALSLSTNCENCKNAPHISQHFGNKRSQIFSFDQKSSLILQRKDSSSNRIKAEKFLHQVKSYFLPNGYESQSTNEGYGRYVSLQALAFIFGTTSSVLSMQCLLFAMGLGENALPLAATLNWVIKDGFGQFGGVIFAGLVNNQYDSDPKRWRMISTVAMEVSSGIEILTPMAPGYFLPMASVANIGKNISFLSASASRAAIHNSFALKENLADITAKSGSQTILSSLIGTSVGVLVSSYIGDNYDLALMVFSACSFMNLFLSYLSLKNVNIHALSINHFDYLYLRFREGTSKRVLNSYKFKNVEFLLGSPSPFFVPTRIGVPVDQAIVNSHEAKVIQEQFCEENFFVTVRSHNRDNSIAEVSLLLKEGAEELDLMKGLATAHLCRHELHSNQYHMSKSKFAVSFYEARNRFYSRFASKKKRASEMSFQEDLVSRALDSVNKENHIVSEFIQKAKAEKWVFSTLLLEKNYARVKIIR